jgi:hypothetical protein
VETFLSKHANAVIGSLSGFDRVVFRGTLRMLAHRAGMAAYLWAARVLLKNFASHAEALTRQLREASEELARQTSRPIRYLASSASSKEDIAREIARVDGITEGLICILTAVEPCLSYEIVRDRDSKRLELLPRHRKCLHLYHYHIHPIFGFMHARIQTWFPFSIQICLNGREWLARSMNAAGIGYVQRDNCFTWLEAPKRAQILLNQQVQAAWPELLNIVARGLNPLHETMFQACPINYYWSTHQSEWATDILFRDRRSLARLYPRLIHHGLTTFFAPDVMRFLGRNIPSTGNIPPRLQGEVTTDMKTRPEGVRMKHRLKQNSIKMYDKQGSVLRVETTINDAADFKVYRTPEGKPEADKAWHRMRKGIADLHRRAEVSQAANDRYLQALASVEDTRSVGELAAKLCQPAKLNGRRLRPLNPYAPDDAKLLNAISRGEFTINGFRNRDVRAQLFANAGVSKQEQRRQSAAVSRKLALLRAHRLIKKVPGTHRYHLTAQGRSIVTALITARNTNSNTLIKLAACSLIPSFSLGHKRIGGS